MKAILILCNLCLSTLIFCQSNEVPEWFMQNMEQSIGKWKTDNSDYKNENEPFESYIMEWEWASNKLAITGKLYAEKDGVATGIFWEFRQYWDFAKKEGILVQYGWNGTMGIGPIENLGDGKTKLLQIFTTPDGNSNEHGHKSQFSGESIISASFNIVNGNWEADRSYTWLKQ